MDELDELRMKIAETRGINPATWDWRFATPDWTRNIAAAYALEESIPEDQRTAYVTRLIEVIRGNRPAVCTWDVAHATPEQRCRAYLAWAKREGEGG
jgi:hypothetical protein